MRGMYNNNAYFGAGVATNASQTGTWFRIGECIRVGIIVRLTATGSPTGTWAADVTDDEDPNNQLIAGATPYTMPAIFGTNNPNGTTTDRNFIGEFNPSPGAKWMRFKYTSGGGGSASLLLNASINTYGNQG